MKLVVFIVCVLEAIAFKKHKGKQKRSRYINPIQVVQAPIPQPQQASSLPYLTQAQFLECRRVETVQPQLICPVNTELRGRVCVALSEMTYQCPLAYIMAGDGRCLRELKAARVMTCPAGYDLSSLNDVPICQKISYTPPQPVCTTGVLQSNQCYDVVAQPVSYCTPGYQLSGSYCINETAVACPPPAIGFPGKRHLAKRGRKQAKCKKRARKLAKLQCSAGLLSQNTCVNPVPVVPSLQCVGIATSPTACSSVQYVNPQFICPRGYTEICPKLLKKADCECVTTEVVQPVPACPAEYVAIQGSQCIQEVAPILQCPQGFVTDAAGTCSRTIITLPTVVHQAPTAITPPAFGSLPAGLSQGIIPTGLGQGIIPTGLGQGIPAGLGQGIPAGLGQGIPAGLGQGIPTGLSQGIPTGLSQGVPTGLSQGVPTGLSQSVPVPSTIPQPLPTVDNAFRQKKHKGKKHKKAY